MILCLQLCGSRFGEGPFLFLLDNDPVHKVRSIQKLFVEIRLEELDWPAQSPDLNPIQHRLRARLNRPTSVPDLTNALVAEWMQIPAAMFQLEDYDLPIPIGGPKKPIPINRTILFIYL